MAPLKGEYKISVALSVPTRLLEPNLYYLVVNYDYAEPYVTLNILKIWCIRVFVLWQSSEIWGHFYSIENVLRR